ncbi:methyltransferase, SAM-dependent [Gottschalkia purinilytica]|uniref:Methyltransferase, SAM-dependent n=1 Tax=Gottschalkia purinilytica TaxID=1503 RepID=A0A0L0WA24_GOTPU|nr:methyltransferase domain-containing protein [Gottschalkia purinilytica]KNF08287.1 methyltransferase, SAM-dependent [Gottschalkia purinilytica]
MNYNNLSSKDLFDFLIKEVNVNFEGWDFSYIESTGRMQEFPLTWSYRNKIISKIESAKSLLDMGTGGGEFLSSIKHIPNYTCATEGYKPNITVAKNKLEPLGVKVYELEDDSRLPFDDKTFDIIINKHESYCIKEVSRILKDKGKFITQQVGGENDKEINIIFKTSKGTDTNWNLQIAVNELKDLSLRILEQKEDFVKTRFYDIGAVVYYLKATPWQIPDFTVEKYFNHLLEIYKIIERKGYIDFTCHRFFIIAEKE